MEIRKTFRFEAAHRLHNHKGRCAGVHGHSYLVEVFAQGEPQKSTGMVVDFGDLKKIAGGFIDKLDHALILHDQDPLVAPMNNNIGIMDKGTGVLLDLLNPRWVVVPYVPTAEMMASHILWFLRKGVSGAIIERVRVHETHSGYAECSKVEQCGARGYNGTIWSTALMDWEIK